MSDVIENEIKNITLDQLLPGDILGFKGNREDIISRLIMDLTGGSDVSHGAIYIQKKDNVLAESGEGGIHSRSMTDDKDNGREVYVLRHNDAGPNGVEQIFPIAKDYVLQGLPYPYSDLILLGLILIFKQHVKKNLVSSAVAEYLCLVAAELKTIIEKNKTQGRHTMVCSSFVYQCYLDASKECPNLKLDVENGDVDFNDMPLLGANERPARTLFDMYQGYVASHLDECKANFKSQKNFVCAKKLRPKEEILADLEKQLSIETEDNLPNLAAGDASMFFDIIGAVKDVIQAMSEFMKGDFTFEEMLENARKQQAMFVTPNDLVKHLANATLLGIAKVHCASDPYDANFKYCCDFLGSDSAK